MGPVRFVVRALSCVVGVAVLASAPGCAEGDGGGGGGRRDGSVLDGTPGDSGGGGVDAFTPEVDAFVPEPDGGPHPTVGTCEACETHMDCESGSFCANLVTGGRACLPGCNPDLPDCPRSFSCIFDASGTGVDATICAPVGGPCCVDEDTDEHGVGVGCMGPDCNDMDPDVRPGITEVCDGIDTNCNGAVDEPPTDCVSGICGSDGDGTYSASAAGTCRAATCEDGMVTDCGLFTCEGGGEEGSACATICNPAGSDDDGFCIESAHCDEGVCVPDVTNGNACDEDSDCGTAHCDNGFCCGMGTCCGTVADCPGGGAVTRICETPMDCQGSRGMAECNADSQCVTLSGIADDTGCSATTMARDCGLYDPIFCNGAEVQTPRACPTSCLVDSDCIEAAHCTVGVCVPDLPPGGPCARGADCQDGLFCTDNVCCNAVCNGTCEACNLPGLAGTCTAVPAGADPAGECAGYSCSGYYDGFAAGEDVCYRRQDVSDAAAVCDGARMCRSPDVVCPTQPRGAVQIDCNNTCQAPRSGTCTGTTSGSCDALDDPAITASCGIGECLETVQRCTGGAPTMCTPGTPVAESCNGLDDDCNGAIDNGTSSTLCPPPPGALSTTCGGAAGCSISMCAATAADIDGVYGNGCECDVSSGGTTCGVAFNLGSIPASGGTASATGNIPPGGERWFRVDFPPNPAGSPGGGTPRIQLTGTSASTHVLQITSTCMATDTFICGAPPATSPRSTSLTDFSFRDSSTVVGETWASRMRPWPSTVYIRVTRPVSATSCAQAAFTLAITR